MKLIVDIPDELYEECKHTELSKEIEGLPFHIIKSVANGTSLPICKTCQEWSTDKRIDGGCYCCNWHNYTGEDFYCGDWVRRDTYWDYCPICGADMRGDTDGNS